MKSQDKKISPQEDTIKATVARLKPKYGKVHVLSVDADKNDKVIAYLKDPERDTMGFFMAKVDIDPVSAAETLLRDCIIEGDMRIVEDTNIFLSTISQLQGLINLKKSSLTTY